MLNAVRGARGQLDIYIVCRTGWGSWGAGDGARGGSCSLEPSGYANNYGVYMKVIGSRSNSKRSKKGPKSPFLQNKNKKLIRR